MEKELAKLILVSLGVVSTILVAIYLVVSDLRSKPKRKKNRYTITYASEKELQDLSYLTACLMGKDKQEVLAKKLGVGQPTISDLLNGKKRTKPNLEKHKKKLSDLFNKEHFIS